MNVIDKRIKYLVKRSRIYFILNLNDKSRVHLHVIYLIHDEENYINH